MERFRDDSTDVTGGVFISHHQSHPVRVTAPSAAIIANTSSPQWPPRSHINNGYLKERSGNYGRQQSFSHDDSSFPSDLEKDDQSQQAPIADRQHYARAEQRTIIIKNLSDRVTHKDIVDIVRGGAVLDIYLRSNDKTASVSFVEGTAAQAFMNYAKRNDIYIHGKRVSRYL